MRSEFKNKKVDILFLISVLLLVVAGFFIFSSASLGLLTRDEGIFMSVIKSQILFGLIGGVVGLIITTNIDYRLWRKYSFHIFILATIIMLLVFVPMFSTKIKGAHRWIDLGFISFQPSEIFKFAFVSYFAAWLASIKNKVSTLKHGLVLYLIFTSFAALLILSQPDTATFGVIAFTGLVMYFVAGARWRDLLLLIVIGLVALGLLAYMRPYVMDRIETFINPSATHHDQSYQIRQSLIAIGSGGLFGRGFGQSVQKFNFLPEARGDSIFAVIGEELGLVGCIFIVLLYVFFALRGLKISAKCPDQFGRLLSLGIVILITVGAMINISSMLGLFPLSGIPLLFISQGGTALCVTLTMTGIILNISKNQTS